MDTIPKTTTDLQLQLWDAKKRTYAPALGFDERGKAWRLAKPDRPLKPRYASPRHNSHSRSIADVQRDYLRWAQAKGLTSIVAYSSKPPPNFAEDRIVGYHKRRADKTVPLFVGAITYTTAEAQFAVEEVRHV